MPKSKSDPYGLKSIPTEVILREAGRRAGRGSKGKAGRAASCGHDYDPNCPQCKVMMRGNKPGCGKHFDPNCSLCKQRKWRRDRREAGMDK